MIAKVGVIGCGVVGSAVADCFEKQFGVIRYDKFKEIGSLGEVVAYADMTFVCVPTATNMETGRQDLGPLTDVLDRLSRMKFQGPVVVKCTVVPGTMDKMRAQFPTLNLVHNPEFLTEVNAKADFAFQKEVMLSGPNADALGLVMDMFRQALPRAEVRWFSDFKTTELAKYIHNCFLATKVAFMNQIYDYAQAMGTNYSHAVLAAIGQGVIGASHTKVPGPDGKRGFGGMCFPKDTTALLQTGPTLLSVLGAAVYYNQLIRPEDM